MKTTAALLFLVTALHQQYSAHALIRHCILGLWKANVTDATKVRRNT